MAAWMEEAEVDVEEHAAKVEEHARGRDAGGRQGQSWRPGDVGRR